MSGALEGKNCLIAGTNGIAAASARLFSREGARIFAVGLDADHADALAKDLAGFGRENVVLTDDLSLPGVPEQVFAAATQRLGRIDVLFHVAGISGRKLGDGPLAECTDEGWDRVMAVNVRAMMQLNRACLRAWVGLGAPGVILNMASVLAYAYASDHFDTVAYAAAKNAIIAMSQHAAATYARHGIRVNVLAPSVVDTPMAGRALQDPSILAFLQRKQPLTQGPLTSENCAQAALFLCSDAASAVTGIVLPVDAGWGVSG